MGEWRRLRSEGEGERQAEDAGVVDHGTVQRTIGRAKCLTLRFELAKKAAMTRSTLVRTVALS